MEEYKSNSHKSKAALPPKKKVEKVVSGKVKSKKKSELRKFTDVFISEDAGNVKSYIFMDVLVPAIKKAVSDIVTDGIRMLLYGETGYSKKNSGASYVSYGRYYDKENNRRGGNPSSRGRSSYNSGPTYGDIILDNYGEADEVLTRMDELIDVYGTVSVADLYDLVGITGNYTDNNYGWTNLRSASIVRVRDGYLLKLPKALPLD